MARKIEFTADYEHPWRSSAEATPHAYTHFKAGMIETVKDEVADAAIALGVGVEVAGKGSKMTTDEVKPIV